MLKLSACIGLVMSAVLSCDSAYAAAENGFDYQVAKSKWERLDGVGPAAGFTRSDTLTGSWSVVSIYVQGPLSPRGRWVARRVSNDLAVPGWADAATCPDLVTSLALLERLSPQRIEILGMSFYPQSRVFTADGVIQTVWSSGGAQPDGEPITVEWSANSGDLARWGQATEEVLAKCWKQIPQH